MSNSNRNNPKRTELASAFSEAIAPHCTARQTRRTASAKNKVKKAMNSLRPTQRGHPRRHIDFEAIDYSKAKLHGVVCFED